MTLRQPSVESLVITSCKDAGASPGLSELGQMDLALPGEAGLTQRNSGALALKATH